MPETKLNLPGDTILNVEVEDGVYAFKTQQDAEKYAEFLNNLDDQAKGIL